MKNKKINWLEATDKQIEDMNYNQAKEIINRFINPEKGTGYFSGTEPLKVKPHIHKALEIILDYADRYKDLEE